MVKFCKKVRIELLGSLNVGSMVVSLVLKLLRLKKKSERVSWLFMLVDMFIRVLEWLMMRMSK